jgi:hypothetical protein
MWNLLATLLVFGPRGGLLFSERNSRTAQFN